MLVSQIADILEVSIYQVHYYIRNGFLKSELKNGIRWVDEEDFNTFYNEYFLHRNKQKGKSIPTLEQYQELKDFTNDIFSKLPYHLFLKKYKNVNSLIPPIEDFKLLKRNLCILQDREDGMKLSDIAKKYELSLRSIEDIVKKYIGKIKWLMLLIQKGGFYLI